MITHLAIHKAGNDPAEYEDAAAWEEGVVVVADGATETFASGIWARALVKHLARDAVSYDQDVGGTFWSRVEAAQADWQAQRPEPVRWTAQIKEAEGAAAAVAVLRVDATRRRWQALAIGDVTIIHLQGQQRVLAWPLDDPDAFGPTPPLVMSSGNQRQVLQQVEGTCRPGDRFLILTDAVAAWALRCERDGHPIYAPLLAIADESTFTAFIAEARAAGMQNDDATLIWFTVARPRRKPRTASMTGDRA